jgi:hypothetical protein
VPDTESPQEQNRLEQTPELIHPSTHPGFASWRESAGLRLTGRAISALIVLAAITLSIHVTHL